MAIARTALAYAPTRITREEAVQYCRAVQAGRLDGGGEPYHLHPEAVARKLTEVFPDWTEDEYNACLAHDLLEDTPLTEVDLVTAGFSSATVEMVREVSNNNPAYDGLSYYGWVRVLAASASRGATRVKACDMWHNSLPDRIELVPEPRRSRLRNKYTLAKPDLLRSARLTDAERAALLAA